ncbi:unnamed protein product (macronuclear) [Paramecium tetraurelia]|uniref:HTH myb-type domain-containing protein n=1 Tax=Paramecium tetraurelia TaxID=5888 RepID=A0BH80_PARTE|nr:uncharacterized protein GSPATT00028932001 [Paramecium tetraurelia]CAK57897.1 unnamed protein product [Paramecium tetraurelia]|eukprot:XP_001425295.1 hypothetical protein (macronuclear) [Paramecium tetraurelia strain d4-2]
MDEAIYIKQFILNEELDEYNQEYHFRLPSHHDEEESLEHLYYSMMQWQSTYDQNDSNKNLAQKRRINDMRFSDLEDQRILELVIQLGPNFNKIVKYFPGKTMNMIKNRYYKKLRFNKEYYLGDKQKSKTKKNK